MALTTGTALAILTLLTLLQVVVCILRALQIRRQRNTLKTAEYAAFLVGSILLIGTSCYFAATASTADHGYHGAHARPTWVLYIVALWCIKSAFWLYNKDLHTRVRALCTRADDAWVWVAALVLGAGFVAVVVDAALAHNIGDDTTTTTIAMGSTLAQAVFAGASIGADVFVLALPLKLPAPDRLTPLERAILPAMLLLAAVSAVAGMLRIFRIDERERCVYTALEGLALQAAFFCMASRGWMARNRKGPGRRMEGALEECLPP